MSYSGIVIERLSPTADTPLLEGLGDHEAALACTRALERVKPFLQSGAHVVMEGEHGAGKRFHAALLHSQSGSLKNGEFVEVTAETSVETLRAILFDEDRKLLERMAGKPLASLHGQSTLYLYGIGEFSIIHQMVLSRFIIQQQNGQRSPYAQTRVIASTSISWPDLLRKKVLIDSLTQSMQQFELCQIPPLRERLDEIPSLLQMILVDLHQREKMDCRRVKEETLERLKTRQWRDNIRELKYVIENAAFNSPEGTLKLPDRLSDEIDLMWEMFRTIQAGKRLTIEQALAALEKAIIERALVKYNFDQRKTARMLAMTEPNLLYRIKKFNIYIPAAK